MTALFPAAVKVESPLPIERLSLYFLAFLASSEIQKLVIARSLLGEAMRSD